MKNGRTVLGIVGLGGYAVDEIELARALERLNSDSLVVQNFYRPESKYLRFAGSDAGRLEQLRAAVSDPEIDIVMALRGGYGMTRLLPLLDFGLLANSNKIFVGHSDFTAFHLGMLAKTGAVSFAGPMICDDFTREPPSEFTHSHFWNCLTNSEYSVRGYSHDIAVPNPSVHAEGKLWGGNLAMLTHLVGTPYFPDVKDGILFLEDVNEHPFRVERMLMQLIHAGILEKQRAVLLGDFSNYSLTTYDNGYDFNAMLSFIRSQLKIPVLTGLPFGHTRDKVTLPVGAQAQLMSTAEEFELKISNYPGLCKQVVPQPGVC